MTRIVLLWVAATIGGGGEFPAVVVERSAMVFSKPDERGYLTRTLTRGSRVVVRSEREDGWSAILAGPDEFEWIDSDCIKPGPEPESSIVTRSVALRVGRSDARLPGPPGVVLSPGALVERLSRPHLTVKGATGTTTWVAVRPPAEALRYVRSREIRPLLTADAARDDQVGRASLGDPPLPSEVSDELVRIDASHASMLKEPLDAWNLDPVRLRYEKLLKSTTDSASQEVIRERLGRLRREIALSDSARRFATLIRESRRRDAAVERIKTRIDEIKQADREGFLAIGLIQPSSKEIGGRKAHVLIGAEGENVAYLDIPQGIDVEQYYTTRVGVHGGLRYDEKLQSRFIIVREVEPIR